MKQHGRFTGPIVVLVLSAMLSACSSSSNGGEPQASPSHDAHPTPSLLKDNGNASFAYGSFIEITENGFTPHTLLSPMGLPIVWRNTTDAPTWIRFDNYDPPVFSGRIPPGQTWSFNPHAEVSIKYHTIRDGRRFVAFVQTQLVGNSGP